MSVTTMIVVIVAIVAFASIRIVQYNRRHGIGPAQPPLIDEGERAALRNEVENLRERVRVLERIATDTNTTSALESRRVSEEIDALRDR